MPKSYSQYTAFLALTKASLRSMLKSPSSVVFSIAFPLVFILVFGLIGDRNSKIKIGVTTDSEMMSPAFNRILQDSSLEIKVMPPSEVKKAFQNGLIQVLMSIEKDSLNPGRDKIVITSGEHNAAVLKQVNALIHLDQIGGNPELEAKLNQEFTVQQTYITDKEFKLIDFILPGQLGFSLLAASVFGTAFVFFHLRQMVVLKRFFATPIKKSVVLLSEGFARLVFQLVGALLIILIGKYFFNYTLIYGWFTVLEMLFISAIGLLVFMSFGFIISGVARSDSVIPPLANIITMPQFLLAGTFFSIEALPTWLQWIAKLMPLTYFNQALRSVAFDGLSLWDVRFDLFILVLWGVIGYAAASKLFKWE